MTWFDPRLPPEPINLAQAKQIKIDMVDVLYEEKCTQSAPYVHWFEGTAEAIAYMAAAVATMRLIGNAAEDALSVIVQDLNANVTIDHGNRPSVNAMVDRWGSVVVTDSDATRFTTVGAHTIVVPGIPQPPPALPATPTTYTHWHGYNDTMHETTISFSHYGIGAFTDQNQILGGGAWVTPAPVNWQPLDTNNRIDIPFATFAAALQTFVSRRTNLITARQTHHRQIGECITIDQVVAHDVTAGWP